ncbi:unnamed protein product [Colias eurytheme]|nr:unnamed protein product [Colias eurytheme]
MLRIRAALVTVPPPTAPLPGGLIVAVVGRAVRLTIMIRLPRSIVYLDPPPLPPLLRCSSLQTVYLCSEQHPHRADCTSPTATCPRPAEASSAPRRSRVTKLHCAVEI